MEELTKEEKRVIVEVFSRIQISPVDPKALESIQIIQSILKKLEDKEQTSFNK